MFLKYFVLSGAIMGLIACVKYKAIAKDFPILEMIGLPAFVIGNTLLGFITLPFRIPVIIHSFFLNLKLKRLIKENESLKKQKEKLDELKDKLNIDK